jgi:hypothetical protein
MRSNVKVFHESIGHKQTEFDVEVAAAFCHAIDFVPNKFAVLRMSALKQQVDRRLNRPLEFKYPIGFFRPHDVAAGDPPAKASRDAESLSLHQIRFASPKAIFSALSIFDIDGCSIPSDDVAGLVPQRPGTYQEPAIFSVNAA